MSCKGITKAQAINIYSHWSMLEYGNHDMNDKCTKVSLTFPVGWQLDFTSRQKLLN